MTDPLRTIAAEYRELIDAALADALPTSSANLPRRLGDAMEYSLLAGGKRIRSLLCVLGCRAVGGDVTDALPAAVALELVHTYSLIHDDLPAMDDDDLRRGRPTCHKQFDEATAILAGDGLLTYSFEYLVRNAGRARLPADVILRSVETLANAAGPIGMVGGQMVDLEAETRDDIGIDELMSIHARKTGRLLSAAVVLGGLAGRAGEKQLAQLDFYGRSVGLAFQIADDLLDETGDAATIGKGVRKDSVRGKATYPNLLGIEGSQAKAEQLISEAIDSIESLGEGAKALGVVAEYIIRRDR